MAAEQRILKQDGYLDVGSVSSYSGDDVTGGLNVESRSIVHHPNLNVILIFDSYNHVKVIDIHSGVVLQTYNLGISDVEKCVFGRYMPLQEKILIWDGHNLGFRGDYNGVLLLDTILQPPILQNDDIIKLELLLSEAIIFQTCLKDLEQEGLECPIDVTTELREKIKSGQANTKKGIKAQRWNTICLEVQYSSLKLVSNNAVIMLKRLERHIPAMAIASAINERLTDLLVGARLPDLSWQGSSFQRILMHSEAVRRQTFEKWPHMDYKWALPDQMAQAGFYHQPSSSGEDRAMCFTCNVCLVCWERTDEPWSEHERHSPTCPFVRGEYTQNVPLSVTYATNPAIPVVGVGFDVISNSDYANVLCTANTQTGDVTVWSIERHLRPMHSFNIAGLIKDICDEGYEWARVTAICVLPNARAQAKISSMNAPSSGSGNGGGSGSGAGTGGGVSGGGGVAMASSGGSSGGATQCNSSSTLRAGVVDSKIVLGLSIRQSTGEHLLRMAVLKVVESDRSLTDGGMGGVSIDVESSEVATTPPHTSSTEGGGDGSDEQLKDKTSDLQDDDKVALVNAIAKLQEHSFSPNGGPVEADFSLFENDLSKVQKVICNLSNIAALDDPPTVMVENSLGIANEIAIDAYYFKEKLMAMAAEQDKKSGGGIGGSSDNNNQGSEGMIKVALSEDIDCVLESCTSVKRMNALASSGDCDREIVEISEIMPINGNCNQLLVKLSKTKIPNDTSAKIIMATVDDEDDPMEDHSNMNSDEVAAQLLLFDFVDSVISTEYTLAVTFSRNKFPQQLCVLPSLQSGGSGEGVNNSQSNRVLFENGALCVVCSDGTVEIYSLVDFQPITVIDEENEHFVSIVYCRSLDRLCGCTRGGALVFYSLNDADSDSGDEMLEMEDECNASIMAGSQGHDKNDSTQTKIGDLTVTDGSNGTVIIADGGGGGVDGVLPSGGNGPPMTNNQPMSHIKVDTQSATTSGGGASNLQPSPSPSAASMCLQYGAANFIAYKTSELSLEDLRALYDLTLFDDNLSAYTAEVPSCWNDLVQAQKQRKQTQNLCSSDDTQFVKTWRLHNDATTWDEHIIELNLTQPVILGHIDLKFSLYQQCHNPATIQVTLLKQNTSGLGYRMKGPPSGYKPSVVNENINAAFTCGGECCENPVVNDEYLQQHNAEILAGPIDLSSCIDLCEQGGIVTLTSPKLFRTRTRNFLLHIKTVADGKECHSKTRGPERVKGHSRLMSSIYAKYSSHKPYKKTTTTTTTTTTSSKNFSTNTITNATPLASSFGASTNSKSKQARKDLYIGCDWLHEISISVRGVKCQNRVPHERLQRIAMLESNILVENLLRITSSESATALAKNLALDLLNWICFIRLNRYRSPKSERLKALITRENANVLSDLLAQQLEFINITEKYTENTIRYCIMRGERTLAHKCVKLFLLITDGLCNLPQEIQLQSNLDLAIREGVARTFDELANVKHASVVRWYAMLVCATSTPSSHMEISRACIKLLSAISQELDKRWDPYGALLGTRFGLYGSPFDSEIFDHDMPNINRTNITLPSSLMNIVRTNAGLMQAAGMDIKRLCSIDGVDFRTFPHLIKCKSVSNQLRGLLEVEQLHFTCSATSEATRIDNMDTISSSNGSNINVEDLIVPPMMPNSVDAQKEQQEHDKMNEYVNNVQNVIVNKMKLVNSKKMDVQGELKPNGIEFLAPPIISIPIDEKTKFKYNMLPKFKAICQYIEYCDENLPAGSGSGSGNSKMSKSSGHSHNHNKNANKSNLKHLDDRSEDSDEAQPSSGGDSATVSKLEAKIKQYLQEQEQLDTKLKEQQQMYQKQEQHQQQQHPTPSQASHGSQTHESHIASMHSRAHTSSQSLAADHGENSTPTTSNIFAWHKLLAPPPKQMIVIDRMHSGARRFVVLDFGSPVVLTDLVIPACDELASLHIDIWCFDEDSDSSRLVVATDIGTKTLILSDLQPPPICRFMKITIIGRMGMSSTKCKIPIGSFYGHAIILEHDSYGTENPLLRHMNHNPTNVQAQIKVLHSLYDDIHCRYSLASNKLLEMLTPTLNSELSNVAHMQAFISKQRDDDGNQSESTKIVNLYEECLLLQHQTNVIRNVIYRLESSVQGKPPDLVLSPVEALESSCRDKLRILSQNMMEILLHFSIEYGIKNIIPVHQLFNKDVANMLFHSLVVYGDAYIQLATCSLLVRMCCFQNWWGDFLADIFCNLYSSQNSKIFPQDRIFFLLTYLGRRSIAMGTCRSIVIDSILKTLAKLLAPISSQYQAAVQAGGSASGHRLEGDERSPGSGLWSKSDLQLITWLLLFLSVCLDDNNERKDKSTNRWDFMSCESDFTKSRTPSSSVSGKQFRCFKKRIIQQNKYGQPYTDWGKKTFLIQNELPGIFMELSGKPKPPKSSKTSSSSKVHKDHSSSHHGPDQENNFDKGLKTLRLNNVLIVIRGLIALLLEMDFTCNMDQFLLTCKVIARLVSACRPSVQLSKIITTQQLEHLVRLAVWNDQQQPWAVHAITCLLQDLLDADKHFKDNDVTPTNERAQPMDVGIENKDLFGDFPSPFCIPPPLASLPTSNSDPQFSDGMKYSCLPSLIECEDAEFDEILDIDIIERARPSTKKDCSTLNKNTFQYFCKSISSAMDSRLDVGLDLNTEVQMRRLTMVTTMDMYSSLPQILTNEFVTTPPEASVWPDYIMDVWSGPQYNTGQNTYVMFKNVFDYIFACLHLEDTWVHLEQVLQMWLTLNGELSDKPYNAGISQNDIPKIPFGSNAAQGLLLALAWHNDIKLRTWCLGFQCLFLACNTQPLNDDDADTIRINEVIVNDENFEKMLLRFFSGYGISSSIITNRCAGPTICKHLHEMLMWLHKKGQSTDGVITCKRKLKDTLLNVILQLVQPGGAISNQQGPIDAQSQLVRDILLMQADKADLNVALNIIESVSFLVYNNISNGEKLQCQRTADSSNPNNTFSTLFANVLGSESTKHSGTPTDSSLIISLLKLCSALIQTELPRQPSEMPIPEEEELSSESQTDETKAEQLNIEGHKVKNPCIADTVLRHFSTMKRLLGALSQCTSNSFTVMNPASIYNVKPTDSTYVFDESQTTADAVFHMLVTMCEKASSPRLIIAPICQYLEMSTLQRNSLPRLQLSEPFLWYISKVLEAPSAVQIFAQLNGVQIICKNLVQLNKTLINMQPGLISLVMQHMTRNTKLKIGSHSQCSSSGKKSSSSAAQAQRHLQDGLINFAPFCSISSENDTAQSAGILIMNPVSSHRRPRTPAWTYMFYPNEAHVDLTITLPTAILLKEVQLQPHGPTLASCPSAVALEVSRDYGLGAIPITPPLTTTGMTCIRLKLAKPEIATSVVLRLYRPKDCSNIGLTQIAVLGNTIFSPNTSHILGAATGSGGLSSGSNGSPGAPYDSTSDDIFAKTSIGWMRILARCFGSVTINADVKLANDVIGASASYPGFLEACCSLMNIMPMIPNAATFNLETVLLKMGAYSRDLCISLIRILLWGTTPQVYKLSNENICDLLYELVTTHDSHMEEKVRVLLEWIVKLRQNFSSRTVRCNNPQSGFVKCIASILWTVHSENLVANLFELIDQEIFESCAYWIDTLENEEPLKVAFDSLLCSLCYVKPILFKELLLKVNVKMQQNESSLSTGGGGGDGKMASGSDRAGDEKAGLTDDSKCLSGSEWFFSVADDNLKVLRRPSYLVTLAMACQSPLAVYQLVDSGLPKLLAYALYEYCCNMLPQYDRDPRPTQAEIHQAITASTAAAAFDGVPSTSSSSVNAIGGTCLTDTYKAEHGEGAASASASAGHSGSGSSSAKRPAPLLAYAHVPKILDFFSECCAEGYMREWLGTQQGVIFWKPLLDLLCNHRPLESAGISSDPMQQAFIRIERATINFFTRVTTCHPKNQDTLTSLLISVIRKPTSSSLSSPPPPPPFAGLKPSISGFTRQIVLQLLLENERILVSVRSKLPLQKRNTSLMPGAISSFSPPAAAPPGAVAAAAAAAAGNGVTVSMVNNHPSKRVSAHHLLFTVSTNAKCQDILQHCASAYSNQQFPTAPTDNTRQSDSGSANLSPNVVLTPSGDIIPENASSRSIADVFGLNFNVLENGMEFLSVAAGVTAKDKRTKDAKNQSSSGTHKDNKDVFPPFPKVFNIDDFLGPSNASNVISNSSVLTMPDYPDVMLSSDTTISQILATMYNKGNTLATPCITLNLVLATSTAESSEFTTQAANVEPLPSPLQRFSSRGGLSLLAQYLPTVYPDSTGRKTPTSSQEKEKSPPMTDWVKLEPNDEIYEDLDDPITEPCPKLTGITSVPQHSLAAFGLFLRLPTYSDVLLRDKLRAQCLLRLVLGVTGDGEGNDIYSLSLAPSLPTLPFEVFRQLLDSSPLTTDDGTLLRRMVIDVGAMHLVLNCLSIFTHQSQNYQISSPQNEAASSGIKPGSVNATDDQSVSTSDDKSHMYWAKGTGFGTGSTAQSWNVEQALMRQKSEEEHVTVLLQVLSSYINPGDKVPLGLYSKEIVSYHEFIDVAGELPGAFHSLLQQSCLIPALSSYLRNDSVLDITRHIPLYRAILQILRALTMSTQLVMLLQPQSSEEGSSPSICELLTKMKTCVDTYAKRLKVNKKSNLKGQTQQVSVNLDDGDDEGLALLIPDIQDTTYIVQKTTNADALATQERMEQDGESPLETVDRSLLSKSLDERYMDVMKKMQFDTYDMIVESDTNSFRFVIPHHFEKMVRMAGDRYHPSRVKRLAQEAVTLSTSLPLSYSSSVFVRCDTDRLDVMKVLITGPADTPYANGCFEFDVYFPPDYPNLPMLINLETTGRHSVRFNPNLYNDGKVCLSVLNTWHGRPEEKWNAQTSSFLQVLVSIQSLILVPEPYFNEPGFERSRGTPSGTHSSREYNSNIYQACVRWGMLEQIRNPSPCFKDVINTHFWLKRNEICSQIENWIEELNKPQYNERNSRTISFNSMVLRRQYRHLREELAKLKVPDGLEDLDTPFSPQVTLNEPPSTSAISAKANAAAGPPPSTTVSTATSTTTINTATATASTTTTTLTSNETGTPPQAPTANDAANPDDHMSSPKKVAFSPGNNSSSSSTSVCGTADQLEKTVSKLAEFMVNMSSPPMSSFNTSITSVTSPSSSSSDCTPIPMLVDVGTDFSECDAPQSLPPQSPVPTPVTATVTTVEASSSTTQQGESEAEGDGALQIEAMQFEDIEVVVPNYTEEEVLQAIFFQQDGLYDNSNMDDYIE